MCCVMRHSLITVLVIFFAIFSLVQTGMTIFYASQVSSDSLFSGRASQEVADLRLCINQAPTLSFDCNTTLVEDEYYGCLLNSTDPDGDNISFEAMNVSGNLSFQINNLTGLFSVIATNDEALQDNVTILFTARDTSDCDEGFTSINITFNFIQVNDAPIYLPNYGLAPHIGPLEWSLDYSTRGIYLNNYFSDPDGDVLTYSHSFISDNFNIIIMPNSEIILGASECGKGQVFIRGTDPYGLFAESNLIELNVPCDDEEDTSTSPSPSPPRAECIPEWVCEDWGRCFSNGTQRRTCTDIHACEEDYINYFWRECDYLEQCENGVQDFWIEGYELNEDGVDCGGPCPPCETCFDEILNNQEEEIDCGGPNCDPCMNCFDGIQNYGEDGVDCGGYCDPCPTCFDNIQNQDEDGVDCGGPCPPCRRLETPEVLSDTGRSILFILIPLAMLVLVAGIIYRIFREQINAFIAKFLWSLVKTNKKQVLLTEEQKNILLSSLKKIESSYSYSASDLPSYQSAIAGVLHQIFDFLLGRITHNGGTLARIHKLSTSKQLKSLLEDYYSFVEVFEVNPKPKLASLNLFFELTRQLVIDISNVSKQDVARVVKEVEVFDEDPSTHILQILYNGILALQFREVEIARQNYLDAISMYYKLDDSLQEEIYDLLHLVFKNVSYVSSYTPVLLKK